MDAAEVREQFLAPPKEPPIETVEIGGMPFRVRGVRNPTVLLHIQKEAEARTKAPVIVDPSRILAPEEILFYTWLEHGLVEPVLSFEEIVRGSEGFGLDCIAAGIRVAELSGALPEAVEELLPFSTPPAPTGAGGGSS